MLNKGIKHKKGAFRKAPFRNQVLVFLKV